MTEEEWLTSGEPYSMFKYQIPLTSSRKLQLVGCACCRQVWELLVDERSREALRLLEEDADDETESDRLNNIAHDIANATRTEFDTSSDGTAEAACLVFDVAHRSPLSFVFGNLEDALKKSSGVNQDTARKIEADVLRDVFGNPFRPVVVESEWLTSTVLTLASQMYESRDFTPMPILADALQDSGCSNDDILNHCRKPGEHVRGCWVIDLLLDKK